MLMNLHCVGSALSEGKQPVRYYIPGTSETIDPEVIDKINQMMAADGLNLELSLHYIPWDSWVSEIEEMIERGEDFELFHIMQDLVPYGTYQGRGSLKPLGELIAKHGPVLKDIFGLELWDCATVSNSIYAVPAEWRDASGDMQGTLSVRQDKLSAAGLSIDNTTMTVDEMIDILTALQAAWGGDELPYVWDRSKLRPPVLFHRSYDSWPFYVSPNGIFHIDQGGKVTAYFMTDEFRRDCEYYAKMYVRGLIHPEALTSPQHVKNIADAEGNVLGGFDTFQEETEPTLRLIEPDADIETYRLYPQKPALMTTPLINANAVPITSRSPEAGIQFLNWLYSRKENHDLLIYGIEGKHYIKSDRRYIKSLVDPDTGKLLHRFDFWMIGNLNYAFFEEGTPTNVIEDWTGCTTDFVASPVLGFIFRSEQVWQQYADVLSAYEQWILPIKMGVLDYDTHIEAALAEMKAAGIDDLIDECQQQLDKYLAEKHH